MPVALTKSYLYLDSARNQYYVQGADLVNRGPWSGSAFYNFHDVVELGNDLYIALRQNSNTAPSKIVDANWSSLIVVSAAIEVKTVTATTAASTLDGNTFTHFVYTFSSPTASLDIASPVVGEWYVFLIKNTGTEDLIVAWSSKFHWSQNRLPTSRIFAGTQQLYFAFCVSSTELWIGADTDNILRFGDQTLFGRLTVDQIIESAPTINRVLAIAANTQIDFGISNRVALTLFTNTTLQFLNFKTGITYWFEIIQDGVGGRTLTWPWMVNWDGYLEPEIIATPSTRTLVALYCVDDASGNPQFIGWPSGVGTPGRLARFADSVPFIRDSAIQDNGVTVGIGQAPDSQFILSLVGNEQIHFHSGSNYGLSLVASGSSVNNPLFSVSIANFTDGLAIFQDTSGNLVYSMQGGGLNVGGSTAVAAGSIYATGNISAGTNVYAGTYVNAGIGYQISGTAYSGHVLLANGTVYTDGSLAESNVRNLTDDLARCLTTGSFANPTAQVGLIAVPGSGTNAMRSNAAPALRQDISPLWSGQHTYVNGIFFGTETEAYWGGTASPGDIITAYATGPVGHRLHLATNDGTYDGAIDIINVPNTNTIGLYTHRVSTGNATRIDINSYSANGWITIGAGVSALTPVFCVATNGGVPTSPFYYDYLGVFGVPSSAIVRFRRQSSDLFTLNEGASAILGSAAIATTATDGFLYLPTCPGPPTGVPTAYTGRAAVAVDSVNDKLYIYRAGWHDVAGGGGAGGGMSPMYMATNFI